MILILAPDGDLHARCVAGHLAECGAQVSILDLGACAYTAEMSHLLSHVASDRAVLSSSRGGHIEHLDLSRVSTIWYRRPRLPKLVDTFAFASDRSFALAEWNAALDGLLTSSKVRFVNEPTCQRNVSKPRQLKMAKEAGLTIPETLVTSSVAEAREFVARHRGRVIHKALTSPTDRFLATKRWSDSDAAALLNLKLAPTIFQEEIEGGLDLRITAMGERLIAAEFPATALETAETSWIDNRLTLDVPYQEHALPFRVEAGIACLMKGLGLTFGTIDMKIDASGDYVFLEVNPQGQFLYVEILTGLPLARTMAEFLISS